MTNAFTPSQSSARRQAAAQEQRQRAELRDQRERADAAAAGSLQDTLQRDTNRLLRVFGTRAMMGGGARPGRVSS